MLMDSVSFYYFNISSNVEYSWIENAEKEIFNGTYEQQLTELKQFF